MHIEGTFSEVLVDLKAEKFKHEDFFFILNIRGLEIFVEH